MNNTDYANKVSSIVKTQLANANVTLTKIVEEMNKVNNEKTTVQNLSNKLTRGTIKFSEILQIADLAGYELNWEKKININISNKQFKNSELNAKEISNKINTIALKIKTKAYQDYLKEITENMDKEKYSDPNYLKTIIDKLKDDNINLKKRTTNLENKVNELFNLLSKCPQLFQELNK